MNPPKMRREFQPSQQAEWMLPDGAGQFRLVYYADGEAYWQSYARSIRIAPSDPAHPSNEPTWRDYVTDAPKVSYQAPR